nr:MAG TPA: hypothetical protein [Caudoviricetes sp.]
MWLIVALRLALRLSTANMPCMLGACLLVVCLWMCA